MSVIKIQFKIFNILGKSCVEISFNTIFGTFKYLRHFNPQREKLLVSILYELCQSLKMEDAKAMSKDFHFHYYLNTLGDANI